MRSLVSSSLLLLVVVVFLATDFVLDATAAAAATAARQRPTEKSRPRNHASDSTSTDASRGTDRGVYGAVAREAATAATTSTLASSASSASLDGPVLFDLTELAFQNCLDGRRTITFALPDEHTAKVEKWWAGGFGDRLLGMVTALYLAVLTDSGFNVHWTWPYDIHDYFDITECNHPSALASLSAATSAALSSASTSALPASSSASSSSSSSSSASSSSSSVSSASSTSSSSSASSSASSPLGPEEKLAAVHRNTLAEHLWNYFTDGKFVQDNDRDILLWSNARHWEEVARHPSTRARVEALGIARLDRRDMFRLGVESLFRHPSRELLDAHARLLDEFSPQKSRTRSAGRSKCVGLSCGREATSAGRKAGIWASSVAAAATAATAVTERPVIGVQIRTGGDGDGWKDPERHPLRSASYCFALEAARLCVEDNVCSVFLTADSKKAAFLFESEFTRLVDEMRAQAKKKKKKTKTTTTTTTQREGGRREQQQPPQQQQQHSQPHPPAAAAAAAAVVVQTPGVIAHTDRSTLHGDEGSASQAWLKSMLDWWALKQADYLLISRSGFGETAAWASNARYVRRLKLAQVSAGEEAGASVDKDSESKRKDANFDNVIECSFDGAEDAFL